MSLGDHLRYLRAVSGGQETQFIAQDVGIESPTDINFAETRYRPVEDEELVAKLADYYGRPVEEFQWHNARARKYLTFYVARAMREGVSVELILRTGEVLSGRVEWWDLSSIGLRTNDDQLLVIQRSAIVDWPDATDYWWEED